MRLRGATWTRAPGWLAFRTNLSSPRCLCNANGLAWSSASVVELLLVRSCSLRGAAASNWASRTSGPCQGCQPPRGQQQRWSACSFGPRPSAVRLTRGKRLQVCSKRWPHHSTRQASAHQRSCLRHVLREVTRWQCGRKWAQLLAEVRQMMRPCIAGARVFSHPRCVAAGVFVDCAFAYSCSCVAIVDAVLQPR